MRGGFYVENPNAENSYYGATHETDIYIDRYGSGLPTSCYTKLVTGSTTFPAFWNPVPIVPIPQRPNPQRPMVTIVLNPPAKTGVGADIDPPIAGSHPFYDGEPTLITAAAGLGCLALQTGGVMAFETQGSELCQFFIPARSSTTVKLMRFENEARCLGLAGNNAAEVPCTDPTANWVDQVRAAGPEFSIRPASNEGQCLQKPGLFCNSYHAQHQAAHNSSTTTYSTAPLQSWKNYTASNPCKLWSEEATHSPCPLPTTKHDVK